MSRTIYIFVPEALPKLSLVEQIVSHPEGCYTTVGSPQQVAGLQLQIMSQDLYSYKITDLPLLSV